MFNVNKNELSCYVVPTYLHTYVGLILYFIFVRSELGQRALAAGEVWLYSCGQSYKQYTLVIYKSRVVMWGIFKSGTTLEL